MTDHVVVDASLAVKWLVREPHTEEAVALGRAWARSGVTLAAPYLLPIEATNVLHRRVARGQMSLERASGLVDFLLSMGIELRGELALHFRALELAGALGQRAAYDSHYLALAEALDCEMWTADGRFHMAAERSTDRVRLLGS